MKILYHVSIQDNKEIKNKIFIPRVPESCADFESKSIKRICFSTSIEKCIIASGILSLLKPDIILNVFTLYVDDNDKYLKDPNYVYSDGNVKDALGNEEYWYMKPVKLYCDNYKLLQIDYEPEIDWKCISIEEIKYALKTIFDYNDIIHKKFIDIISKDYNTSEEYYNEAAHYLSDNKYYNECDELYYYICEKYRWCQSYKINKLELQEL